MIEQHSGHAKVEAYKKTASTAIAKGRVVTVSSGLLVGATHTTARKNLIGICMRDITATDSDYAQQTPVPVVVLDNNNNEFVADVGAGTAVQAMVGGLYDLHTDGESINVGAQLVQCFRITKVISATKVIGRFETSNIVV